VFIRGDRREKMWDSISSLFAIILVVFLVNGAVMCLIYTVVRRIPGRAARLVIPVLVMLAGYLVLMKADPANLILGSHFFVLPMAILLSAFLIYGLADPATGFTRIMLGDFFATLIAVMVLGFVLSSGYLNTLPYYRNLALSNGLTYAGIIVFDLLLAIILFKLMREGKRTYPVRVREET
jgi:hypothetical protein